MEYVALFLTTIAALSAVVTRWTRVHPFFVAAIAGVPGGVLGMLVAGMTLSDSVWQFAGIAFVITAVAGAMGAYLGWLRRDYLKRII